MMLVLNLDYKLEKYVNLTKVLVVELFMNTKKAARSQNFILRRIPGLHTKALSFLQFFILFFEEINGFASVLLVASLT